MKTRGLLAFTLIVGFALGPVRTEAAEAPEPPPLAQLSAPAVAFGEPGLSYRYVQTFGVSEEAYPADVQHLNNPSALFMDSSDNLFVVEGAGSRVLKYRSSDGVNLLSIGKAGMQNRAAYSFSSPYDAALDSAGNIWVVDNHRTAKYDASGQFLLEFPAADPWASGSDQNHFNAPRGLAFDGAGRLFVSDGNNHRIQVFQIVSGTPVYSATIGVTGVYSTANGYFNYPTHIAFDSAGRLYVADSSNQRVQRCVFSGSAWACATFFGVAGVTGTDLTHLGVWFNGITIRNDTLFIADGANHRVLKCNLTPVCSVFAGVTGVSGTDDAHLLWPSDVAVDTAGHVYVSEYDNHRVQEFTSGGVWVKRFGVTKVPYVPDTSRFNAPMGIAVAADGSIYFTEGWGYRLVKLNAAGALQWTVGQAGVKGNDAAHFDGRWDGLAGNVAVDAAGRVYVPDTGNNRIQIYDASTGAFVTTWGSSGSGPSQFNCPWGVAISPVNGDFYVADRCNNRIQVFDSSRVYKTQLGSGSYGASDTQFAGPTGVAVDLNGAIYVADGDNNRVQKCGLSGLAYTCALFAGVSGQSGDTYDRFRRPYAVAVDASGRLYVADADNQRVQVFGDSGAYLTTLGGSWGAATGQLRNPKGVALDSQGYVYVTDNINSRIQKLAPGVPGWQQVNLNGFGARTTSRIFSMAVFSGELYAGAAGFGGPGAAIWRASDGLHWSPVMTAGFGSPATNPAVLGMLAYNGQLYAGTGWSGAPGQMWRSPNGTTWNQVAGNGLGVSSGAVASFATYSATLYMGTCGGGAPGAQIWRSATGDSLSWSNVVTAGNTTTQNGCITSMVAFNDALYAAVENVDTGVRIWRTVSGDSGSWSQSNTTGFGTPNNIHPSGLAVFGGYLYVGTRNKTTGAQLWRSNNGTTWDPVMTNGFGDTRNEKVESLYVFDGALYAGTDNAVTGAEVWRSRDGSAWSQINLDGFGDSNNTAMLWSSDTIIFNNQLYMGIANDGNGAEIWKFVGYSAHLPMAIR